MLLRKDWGRSKGWVAMAGVFCPLMAVGTGFGFLLLIGYKFVTIITVAPFLVLAIGVDDAFIMLHAWEKTRVEGEGEGEGEGEAGVEERVGRTLRESGPSITITSLTNALSFGIGAFSGTPAINLFCTFTAVAIATDYFFQITFFLAILTFGGRREAANKRRWALPCCASSDNQRKENFSPETKAKEKNMLFTISFPFTKITKDISQESKHIFRCLSDSLVSWPAKMLVGFTVAAYWATAGWGCTLLQVGLRPENLFLEDSILNSIAYIQREYIFKEGDQVFIFVNNPGDLRNQSRVARLLQLVDRFETAPYSRGILSTNFWLKAYMKFLDLRETGKGFHMQMSEFTYKYLPEFSRNAKFGLWNSYLSLDEDGSFCQSDHPRCLKRFFFTTGFGGVSAWSDRAKLLAGWRELASEFGELNVSSYENLNFYTDQYTSIAAITLQTVLIAFICMASVCVLFIPNPTSILCAVFALLSINVGVFGGLALWRVDLDPISMATILMSIGFSVDFTAHISYHFYKGTATNRKDRLWEAMESIGWPMLQAGISTLLSVIPLACVPSYVTGVFVKTVFLVVVLGLLHGLLLLPVLLTTLPFHKKLLPCIPPQRHALSSSPSSAATDPGQHEGNQHPNPTHPPLHPQPSASHTHQLDGTDCVEPCSKSTQNLNNPDSICELSHYGFLKSVFFAKSWTPFQTCSDRRVKTDVECLKSTGYRPCYENASFYYSSSRESSQEDLSVTVVRF